MFKRVIKKLLKESKMPGITVYGDIGISVLRKEQNAFLRDRVGVLPNIKSVLNAGSNPEALDKEGLRYRDYFPNAEFYTLDKNVELKYPNHFCLDLHDLSMLNKRFDLVLCMSVLEHVKNPFVVAKQLKSVIADGGYLFVSVPLFYPVHKSPDEGFSDYWRFTDDGLRELFEDLNELWIMRYSSVIIAVRDRNKNYDEEKTASGYCALFRKENESL